MSKNDFQSTEKTIENIYDTVQSLNIDTAVREEILKDINQLKEKIHLEDNGSSKQDLLETNTTTTVTNAGTSATNHTTDDSSVIGTAARTAIFGSTIASGSVVAAAAGVPTMFGPILGAIGLPLIGGVLFAGAIIGIAAMAGDKIKKQGENK